MSASDHSKRLRIGLDLGGTKIEGLALGPGGSELVRRRIASPQGNYRATVEALKALTEALVAEAAGSGIDGFEVATVGVGMPGSLSPATGCVQNANSTWLNGQRFDTDLSEAIGRPVRFANDANCFALSEAVDGAGADAHTVFGVILGTGVGGGVVVGRRLLDGPRGTGGEWGHNPLPWAVASEVPGPMCWCGRRGCLEAWLSGPALQRDHLETTGETLRGEDIAARAEEGDAGAVATLKRHCDRLARGLAHVINIVDPDAVVLGGGLSGLGHLYRDLPIAIRAHLFTDNPQVDIRPPRWGNAGGVRGAAWLWD